MANPEIFRRLLSNVEPINWRKLVCRLVIIIVAMTLSYHAWILFRITRLRHTNPTTTNLIELRTDSLIERGSTPKIRQRWVPYQNISPHLVRAVLVGEDIRFYLHSGIDWTGVHLAMKKNWE